MANSRQFPLCDSSPGMQFMPGLLRLRDAATPSRDCCNQQLNRRRKCRYRRKWRFDQVILKPDYS